MKKVYIKPKCASHTLRGQNLLLVQSYNFVDSREQRDDRFEDYEDYDNDPNDFDGLAFWDD